MGSLHKIGKMPNGSRAMAKWVIGAAILAALTGCQPQQQAKFSQSKADAQGRWVNSRAGMFMQLAQNRYESGQLDGAAESAMQALSLQGDLQEAKVLLARILLQQGQYTQAAARLAAEVEASPESAELVYLLAIAQEKKSDLKEALASYRKAYGLDETCLAAVQGAAEVLVAMGETRQAQMLVESWLPKAGEDAAMHELAGRLAMTHREHAKAAKHYAQARDLDPRNVRYLESLAQAYYGARQYDAALDTMGELVGREDYIAPAWAYMIIGDCHMAMDVPGKAFDAYFKAGELAPREGGVWTSLARAALAMNDNPRAILSARRAMQMDASSVEASMVLGYALMRSGQAGEAVKVLEPLAGRNPRDAMIQCVLGRAHIAAGEDESAVKCFKLALEIDPANAVAKELLAARADKRLSKLE
jgi:tetratricopeptide (TPR) repeat protein